MKKSKILITVFCAVLLVVASVVGTLAYLTSESKVVNTFTVGNVQIKLDESNVVNGVANGRTEEGNQYHLLPGGKYLKDPTVTVLANSENCYVRMFVTVNNIADLKEAFGDSYIGDDGKTFLLQNLVNWNAAWEFESCVEDTVNDTAVYEFRYNQLVVKNSANTQLPALFTQITIPGDLDNTAIAKLAVVSIDVIANAMQADGFVDADDAWNHFN